MLRWLGSGWRLKTLSLVGGAVVWQVGASIADNPIIPTFTAVLRALRAIIVDGTLLEAIAVTSQAFGIGLGAALVAGIAVGVLVGLSSGADYVLSPYVSALLALPSVAYIPVVMLWLGFDVLARSVVVFEFAFLTLVITTRTGFRSIDRSLIDMARSFNLSRTQTFWNVTLRAATPAIFAGVRLAVGRAVKGVIIAEVLLTLVGLGGLVDYFASAFQVDLLLAVVIAIITIALILTQLLALLDRRVHRWTGDAARP